MNNQETLNQAHIIQSLKATDVIRNEYVRQQFINVYNAIWKEGGEGAYEREAMYFNNQLRGSEKLRKCTGMSVFFAFIDLAVRGLTLEPGAQALCYLLPQKLLHWQERTGAGPLRVALQPYNLRLRRTGTSCQGRADTICRQPCDCLRGR
jgi:hypothetical protein